MKIANTISEDHSSLKYPLLGLLICSNIAYGLLLPLSRVPDAQGNLYYGPASVVVIELVKALVAMIGLFFKHFYASKGSIAKGEYTPLPPFPSDEVDEKDPRSMKDDMDIHRHFSVDESSSDSDQEGDIRTSNNDEGNAQILVKKDCLFRQIVYGFWADIANISVLRLVYPAILYTIQNNLQIFAAGFLGPAEFQVLNQLKLLSTALFSVWILERKLNRQHWMCIGALCIGVILVQVSGVLEKENESSKNFTSMIYIGVPSMLAACCCAGLAGVLTESLLKGRKISLCFWVINIYLALFSLVPALVPIIFDSMTRGKFDPFRYFNKLVWAMIMINVIGGILVSLVIKYADSILKGFAVSIALILTILASAIFTHTPVTILQVSGGLLVSLGTFYYGKAS